MSDSPHQRRDGDQYSPIRKSGTPERRNSGSPGFKRNRSPSPRRSPRRYRSRSPMRRRRSPPMYKKKIRQESTEPSKSNELFHFLIFFVVVGFFGLPRGVKEEDMKELISEHGKLEKFTLVLDKGVCFLFI
jgi:hypothetical protein